MSTNFRDRPVAARVAVALGLVYVVWGSTYLAIRVAVETLPPLISAGVRFLVAGAALYAFMIRRTPQQDRPTRIQWRSASIIGALLLVGGNGGVVLAESRGVPSGIAALLVGAVPLWMALIGFVVYRQQIRPIGIAGLVIGFAGVGILAKPSGAFPIAGTMLIMGATFFWSIGSLYTKRATLPKNPMLTTAMEMLAGGALLMVAGLLLGEASHLRFAAISSRSLVALAYLIVIGSMVGYTSYVYALTHASTSLVSTYAYVNPVIAVLLGSLILHEPFTGRDIVGGAIIVASVALIVWARPRTVEPPPAVGPTPDADAIDAVSDPRAG